VRALDVEKKLPQALHGKVRSPVCTRMCTVRLCRYLNALPHMVHSYTRLLQCGGPHWTRGPSVRAIAWVVVAGPLPGGARIFVMQAAVSVALSTTAASPHGCPVLASRDGRKTFDQNLGKLTG
jgi:hypothetical protein